MENFHILVSCNFPKLFGSLPPIVFLLQQELTRLILGFLYLFVQDRIYTKIESLDLVSTAGDPLPE